MSQLRKLRRNVRPRLSRDLETLPLRAPRLASVSTVDGFDAERRALHDVKTANLAAARDLETLPRRAVMASYAAAGGLSAETIARHTGYSIEGARGLIEACRKAYPFDLFEAAPAPTTPEEIGLRALQLEAVRDAARGFVMYSEVDRFPHDAEFRARIAARVARYRQRHPETMFSLPTGREPRPPELQRCLPRTEVAQQLRKAFQRDVAFANFADFAALETRIAEPEALTYDPAISFRLRARHWFLGDAVFKIEPEAEL